MTTRSTISAMPTATVPDRWDALFDASERPVLERALVSYVAGRRWYRTKSKRVQSASVVAAFPLAYGDDLARIALVEVLLDDGTPDRYAVPLGWVKGEVAATVRARRPESVVLPLRVIDRGGGAARRRGSGVDGLLVDALAVDAFLDAFLQAAARGGAIDDAGWTLRFHTSGAAAAIAAMAPAPVLVDREQTNSSVVYGDALVAKLVRKLDAGESPDLEIGRFLTEAGYPATPALVGWVDVRQARDPSDLPSTIAVLHSFVANRGDAWEHTLAVLDAWLGAAAHRDAPPPKLSGDLLARATQPLPPDVLSAVGSYAALAELLGRRVGEMHVALSSRPDDEAFAPEPLDAGERSAIATRAHSDLSRAMTILGARSSDLPENARLALSDVRVGLRTIEGRLSSIARLPEGGIAMRVHGDLHLGQVLFTGTDFAIIDFEGEPARSLAERRQKRSPLVDVAGMIRSFHYASVAALRARPESTRAALSPWAVLWQRAAAAAFLRGWLAAVDGSIVVPADPAVTRALLELFLLEKGIYELAYELNHRPDWVVIPLLGLRELLERDPVPTTPAPAS